MSVLDISERSTVYNENTTKVCEFPLQDIETRNGEPPTADNDAGR